MAKKKTAKKSISTRSKTTNELKRLQALLHSLENLGIKPFESETAEPTAPFIGVLFQGYSS